MGDYSALKLRMYDMSVKEAKDLVVGDKLMGFDGEARTVTEVSCNTGPCFRYRGCNVGKDYVMSLRTTKDIKDSLGREFESGAACNISVEDYLACKPEVRASLKSWYGVLRLESKDVDTSKYVEPYIMGLILMNEEFCANRHINRRIPDRYLYSTPDDKLALLAGMIESQDYFSSEADDVGLLVKGEGLIDDIVMLAGSMGYSGRIDESEDEYYIVTIRGNISKIPLYAKYPETSDVVLDEVEVEAVEEGEYYSVVVKEDNKLVLSSDFVVCYAN